MVDKDTREILKFGETLYLNSQYSQTYLDSQNAETIILESRSKVYIHNWQRNMNGYYEIKYGEFPPLNKRGW